jgi:hypothetical protein
MVLAPEGFFHQLDYITILRQTRTDIRRALAGHQRHDVIGKGLAGRRKSEQKQSYCRATTTVHHQEFPCGLAVRALTKLYAHKFLDPTTRRPTFSFEKLENDVY